MPLTPGTELREPSRFCQLKADTRQWTSGRVRFAVIGRADGKQGDKYIVFEKTFFGRSSQRPQKFILHEHDWKNLKRLIDGDLVEHTGWETSIPSLDQAALSQLLQKEPDLFEKLLANPNVASLSSASMESLDRLAVRLYEIKTERLDVILQELSRASGKDIETFSSLLEDLRLSQVSTMAALVYQKLKMIDLLEATCGNPEKSEADVHEIFEANPWLVGKTYEIVQSDRTLATYLQEYAPHDPETKKRPDLILKTLPNTSDVILIELKAPGVKLKAQHIGQVLEYKAIIQQNKPNVEEVHCFVYGYQKDVTFLTSKDAEIRTFSEVIAQLRAEYREYARIIEAGREAQSL